MYTLDSSVTLNANMSSFGRCMHRNICDNDQVHDINEFKQHLMKFWRGLGQSVIDDSHKRLWSRSDAFNTSPSQPTLLDIR